MQSHLVTNFSHASLIQKAFLSWPNGYIMYLYSLLFHDFLYFVSIAWNLLSINKYGFRNFCLDF